MLAMHAHACPKCGEPDSAYGETFCSPCESKHAVEMSNLAERLRKEAAAYNAAMAYSYKILKWDGVTPYLETHSE